MCVCVVRYRFESPPDALPAPTLLGDLKALVDNELLSDVTFIVEGTVPVRAHKVSESVVCVLECVRCLSVLHRYTSLLALCHIFNNRLHICHIHIILSINIHLNIYIYVYITPSRRSCVCAAPTSATCSPASTWRAGKGKISLK